MWLSGIGAAVVHLYSEPVSCPHGWVDVDVDDDDVVRISKNSRRRESWPQI